MLSKTFEELRQRVILQQQGTFSGSRDTDNNENEPVVPMSMNALCQTVTSEVPRIYHFLNGIERTADIDA
eukprot:13897910-Ditylum_brightwellii.AAC.1